MLLKSIFSQQLLDNVENNEVKKDKRLWSLGTLGHYACKKWATI